MLKQKLPPNKNNKKKTDDDNSSPKEPNISWKGAVFFAMIIMLITLALYSYQKDDGTKNVPLAEFKNFVINNPAKIASITLVNSENSTKQKLVMMFKSDDVSPSQTTFSAANIKGLSTFVDMDYHKEEIKSMLETANKNLGNITDTKTENPLVLETKTESDAFISGLLNFLPLLLLIVIIFLIFRQQIKMVGKGAMNFGKSKAKLMEKDGKKITFSDVAGVEEAREEVWELVEFLKDPKKFQTLGGNIPKGVLMVGPPGTGKTLIARAIAGEADVPFFSISGSDFVEMFVGVGASRVRDMFEQGKKNAPCLIFIDEIDAVGRHRGHGLGGGHDEREQTLNALLVEMDGFETQEGIIIVAATNRPDVLDPALLRPGRFDRQVVVNLPDVKGREQILKVHAKKIKLRSGVDLSVLARGTPGYSGAELANVINEAALLAARKNLKAVGMAELEEARDKVRWGRERRSLALSEKEKENTAYHEAGHALLNVLLKNTDPLHKVTIIPRGPALGVTMFLPEEDKYNMRKKEIKDQLIVLMGGRVAEEITFGDVTSGAMGDIRQATNLTRKMVCEWGMSDKLGMIEYGSNQDHIFLARDMGSRTTDYSESTAQKIDTEIKKIIDTSYNKAKKIITEHRESLKKIAEALIKYETLEAHHIEDIVQHGDMKNPPVFKKDPPAKSSKKRQTKRSKKIIKKSEDDDGLEPEVVPAT